jgi:methylmalonyl-CoA/ethylmalonyl-CoA epimerase
VTDLARTEEVAPDATGSGLRFHHVGVAVTSIERALGYYTGLFGFRQHSEPIDVPAESVRVCFVEAPPGVLIELIEGIGDSSPVKAIAEKVGGGTYHICYEVDDIDQTVATLRRSRCFPFRRFEMPGHGRFAFLLTPDRQLFELCEPDQGGHGRGPKP